MVFHPNLPWVLPAAHGSYHSDTRVGVTPASAAHPGGYWGFGAPAWHVLLHSMNDEVAGTGRQALCRTGARARGGPVTMVSDGARARTPLERRALAEPPDADWCPRCWNRWLRARTLEHLGGERYWQELDRGGVFGLLRRPFHPDGRLVRDVVDRLAEGSENLTVIQWAIENRRPLGAIVDILAVIDINARRIRRFEFLPRHGACRARPSVRSRPVARHRSVTTTVNSAAERPALSAARTEWPVVGTRLES
jgi:hypothetical protein